MEEGQARQTGRMIDALLDALRLFERVQRMFHPVMIPRHGEAIRKKARALLNARQEFLAQGSGSSLGTEGRAVIDAVDLVLESAGVFRSSGDARAGVFAAMRAMRKICRAKEALFGLRGRIPQIDDFFREVPADHTQQEDTGPYGSGDDPGGGDVLIHTGVENDPYARGASSLFVPEAALRSHPLPLVIALHGGFGHGRDFLWTWVRQARTRGFFLLAPTSSGATWSLEDPLPDLTRILARVDEVSAHHAVDTGRMLLTGLSDGATFALCCAMQPSTPFSAFAPVAGVLPPGELSRTAGRRIYWVHGAHDWIFPADRARLGRSRLLEAGARASLKVVETLAHAHPCEENRGILTWFDPALVIPNGRQRLRPGPP